MSVVFGATHSLIEMCRASADLRQGEAFWQGLGHECPSYRNRRFGPSRKRTDSPDPCIVGIGQRNAGLCCGRKSLQFGGVFNCNDAKFFHDVRRHIAV